MGILGALIFWQAIAWLALFNPIYFASPSEVALETIRMAKEGTIFTEIVVTLYRIFSSVLISSLIGIPLAIALGYYSHFYEIISHILIGHSQVPDEMIGDLQTFFNHESTQQCCYNVDDHLVKASLAV